MKFIAFVLIVSLPAFSHAQTDPNDQKALKQTQDLLRNPTDRQKAIENDPKAKDADAKVSALAGNSENKEAMYELSAQLMEKLVKETNGDPTKMQALMTEAAKNPEAFYNKYFSDSQKSQVKSLAGKIEKQKPAVAGPGN